MDEVALVCHRVPSLMDPTGDTGSRRVMIKLNGRITSCCPDHLTPGRLEKKKRKKNGQKFTSIFHRNHRRSNPPLPPLPLPRGRSKSSTWSESHQSLWPWENEHKLIKAPQRQRDKSITIKITSAGGGVLNVRRINGPSPYWSELFALIAPDKPGRDKRISSAPRTLHQRL